jgi:hypothetical protein
MGTLPLEFCAMERPIFICPKCGSSNAKQIALRHDRCFKPFTEGDTNGTEPATTYAFQCTCGAAFTETVREGAHENSRPIPSPAGCP